MSIQMLYLFRLSILGLVGHSVLGNGSRSSIPVELHSTVCDVADPEVASRGQRHWSRRRDDQSSKHLEAVTSQDFLLVQPEGAFRTVEGHKLTSSCNEKLSQEGGDLRVVP